MEYEKLCGVYSQLETTSKRLEKTGIISNFLKQSAEKNKNDLKNLAYLLRGMIFPDCHETEIGMSSQLVIKVVAKSAGVSSDKIVSLWKKLGDLGKVAENLITEKKQGTLFFKKLTTDKVINNLRKLSVLEGKGTVSKKINFVSELLSSASPVEAKYIIRTVLGELRIGVAAGTLRDSITWAFGKVKIEGYEILDRENYNKKVNLVQEAYDVSNDFGKVIETAVKDFKKLKQISIGLGKPIKAMLALKVENIKEAFKRCGEPCQFVYKLDGFRLQVHKNIRGEISLFTRRLDNVTKQFPEVVSAVSKYVKGKSFILDAEAVGFNPKNKEYRPFQEISQRIRRKYHIEKLQKELPVELNVFDLLYYNGKSLIKESLKKRNRLLGKIIKDEKWRIVKAKKLVTSKEKEAEKFYEEAVKLGMEGLMAKKLDTPYKPGARVGYMVKLKPGTYSFDLVITGAEWGTGKRSGWLSSFILSCKTKDGKFLEIGKVGTGIKEKEEHGLSFEQLTKMLVPLIIESKGRIIKVQPKIIVEVIYQEIQKSPNYSSGFALRFPRILKLRDDLNLKDVESLDSIKTFYQKQKFGK